MTSQHPPQLADRVAEEIRSLMGRRRISGRQLAEAAGIPKSTASRWIAGVTEMGLNDLERVAYALGVSVVDLLPADAREAQPVPLPMAAGAENVDVTRMAHVAAEAEVNTVKKLGRRLVVVRTVSLGAGPADILTVSDVTFPQVTALHA